MQIQFGKGITKYGPGVSINLTGAEVATVMCAYLMAHDVYISGPRTISFNEELCESGHVYVDPSGTVVAKGKIISGRGPSYSG